MARYAAIASGDWNTAATWARVGFTSTFHASSTSSDLGATPQFTDTFTAPNTTAQALGFIAYLSSFSQANSTYTVTLQEYNGATWVDKNTGTYTVTGTGLGNDYYRFDITPYTYTTTTANYYRYKIVRTTGTGGLFRVRLRSAGTDWGIFALDNRGAEPVDTDTVMVIGSDPGGTDLEVTVNGTRAVGNAGSASIGTDLAQDYAILQGGTKVIVKWDTTQNSQLTIKGIWYFASGQINMGTKTTPYPSAYVAKMIFNQNGTTGNYGIFSEGRVNPTLVLNGSAPTAYAVDYVSGSGTTASPLITSGDLGAVGDEIAIAATGDYSHTEYKFIKTKNSATSYVLADTAGGAESGLAQTHSTDAKICNLQRNVIVTTTNTSHAWWFYLQASTSSHDYYFKNARFEYFGNSGVGRAGISIGFSTGQANAQLTMFSGNVGYQYFFNVLQWYQIPNPVGAAYDDNIFCRANSAGSQPAVTSVDTANKTCNRWYFLDGRAAGFQSNRGTSNTYNDFYIAGCNTTNISNQGGIHFVGTQAETTYNNAKIIACRRCSLSLLTNTSFNVRFVNSAFAPGLSNTIDINAVSNQYYNQITFDNCTFNSATLISNYTTQLNGTEFRFNKYQATANEHRWYTPQGQARSSGAGLTETTVRTAGSLALAFLPEDATNGFSWSTKIPASPSTNVFINGYVQRNATFSSGDAKVELFLPGSTTADATYTFPTTTGSWLPFNISAYYSGTETLFATVKFTGVTATAGAEMFIDDLYDAGTSNKLAGLDVWDEGKPSPVLAATDVSAIPAQVWAYPDTSTNANTMGQRQVDAADDAELAAIK